MRRDDYSGFINALVDVLLLTRRQEIHVIMPPENDESWRVVKIHGRPVSHDDLCRIGALVKALDAFERKKESFRKAFEITKPKSGYARRAFLMETTHESDSGGEPDAELEVDLETGRLIFAAAEAIIREELKKLGVEIDG